MPLGVSKDCFPDPTECHNCQRKGSTEVKRKSEQTKSYKRCSNCHLLTYCDTDCQKEHWMKIHRHHCRFLSGKTLVKNSEHINELDTTVTLTVKRGDEAHIQREMEKAKQNFLLANCCNWCVEEDQTSDAELYSKNSPKTICDIEHVISSMKTALGNCFGFHGEGKKCNCSSEYACELPFSLGEVSGQYIEMGTGLDVMLAHSLNIVTAMIMKWEKEDARKKSLRQLWQYILQERSLLWLDILISGVPNAWIMKASVADIPLNVRADSLMNSYGDNNPWSICLKIAVDFFSKTRLDYASNAYDSGSLEDPRFKNLKLIIDYQQSQLRNQAIVAEKKLWPKFMLWPTFVNNSLVVILPDGTRCQGCFEDLSGQRMGMSPLEDAMLGVGVAENAENGALMASCSSVTNPNCGVALYFKSVKQRMQCDKEQWNKYQKESDDFMIESRDCDFCFKLSLSSHRCLACRSVQYCSTVCQKKDLDFHKTVCATWAKDKSRRILGGGKQKDLQKATFGKKKATFGKL